jgi:disulfide bond formation protein DsbB
MVSLTLAFLVLILNKYERISLIVIGLFFVFGTIVSFYHIGIEQGIFNESLVCFLETENKAISAEGLLKELETKSVSCKDVTFRIFGLSLATLNTIISFVISVIIILRIINYDKN